MRAIETLMSEGQKAEEKRQARLHELTEPLRKTFWRPEDYYSAADVIELLIGFARADPLEVGDPFEDLPRYRITALANAVMRRERERESKDVEFDVPEGDTVKRPRSPDLGDAMAYAFVGVDLSKDADPDEEAVAMTVKVFDREELCILELSGSYDIGPGGEPYTRTQDGAIEFAYPHGRWAKVYASRSLR